MANVQKKSGRTISAHEKLIRIIIISLAVFGLAVNLCRAQDRGRIIREGNNFKAIKATRTAGKDSTATPYTYTDSKGQIYKVYLSKSGKAFIPKTSAKTGKYYRQYKPEITTAINESK